MEKNEQMIKDFVNAITAEVNERRAEIERDSQEYVKGQLEAAEAEILEEVYAEVQRKSADIKAKIGRDISVQMSECRRQLLMRRNELAEDVFAAVEEKITAFTESGEYEQFLINSTKRAKAALSGECVAHLRPADMKYAGAVKNSGAVSVEPDDNIRLGGVTLCCGNLTADDTLDARFDGEKAAFRENYKIEI